MPLMRQTSIVVISPLAACARMSTIWASVYLVCFTLVSSQEETLTPALAPRSGGIPQRRQDHGRALAGSWSRFAMHSVAILYAFAISVLVCAIPA